MVIVTQADLGNPHHATGIVDCLDAYARDPMGGGQALSAHARQNLVAGLAAHPASVTFIAQAASQIVGVAVCFFGYSTFQAKPRLNLHDLIVLPTQRRRGIGRALLDAVAAHAAACDCCAVTLEVRKDNPTAQALYRSLGFGGGNSAMEFWVKPVEIR
ncbi:MAG: family acetyltransferase [Proteobacteria bacterium]|nr:family acetyltransferase [Pseudomonadota bacterium]